MAILVLSATDGEKRRVELPEGDFVVGRDLTCDLTVADPSVSRRHAVFNGKKQRFSLKDLGSKNGTTVNGRPVTKTRLNHGDQLHFGDIRAVFYEREPESDARELPPSEETFLLRREDLPEAQLKLHLLFDLAETTASLSDETAVVHTALAAVQRQLDCDRLYLGLVSANGEQIVREFSTGPDPEADRPPARVRDDVLASGRAWLINDAQQDERLRNEPTVTETDVRSLLCAPLAVTGHPLGLLYAASRGRRRPFTKNDVAFAGVLGTLLGGIMRNLRAVAELRRENRDLHRRLGDLNLIGDHPAMQNVREQIHSFATRGDAPVLIHGESGTGKEVAARLIHHQSERGGQPFLDVNCAAMPRDLIESELFGHMKGAFTSAGKTRQGLFELADGGTLFLDEIGELPLDLQSKLLRVAETGEFRPIGAERSRRVDVRLITATNRDLAAMVEAGRFRRDLYFRINILALRMPPLREHPEDVPALARHFLEHMRRFVATRVRDIEADALALLQHHTWPGNVRELKNVIERALYTADDETLNADHFRSLIVSTAPAAPPPIPAAPPSGEEDDERTRILAALEAHRWNRTQAAEALGISRKTLFSKMKRYSL